MERIVIVWLIGAVAAGCSDGPATSAEGTPTVAVSIAPTAWLVEQIAGDHVRTVTLVESGQSPATYQPTEAQVTRVMRSAVYLRIGVPFERGPWFEAIHSAGTLRMVDLREGIKLRRIERHTHHEHEDHGHDEAHTGADPHIWLHPGLLRIQAQRVAETLKRIAPSHAKVFDHNTAALSEHLKRVDERIDRILQPYRGRAFYVFHPAWGYFADAYGLRQVAIEIAGKTPSDAELTQLQRQARADGVTTIFVQPQFAGPAPQAVARAINGRVVELDPLKPDVMANLLYAAEQLADSFSDADRSTE